MIPNHVCCPKCQYDLHGLPIHGRCPECGRCYKYQLLLASTSQKDHFLRLALVFLGVSVLVMGTGYYCFITGFAGTHFKPNPLLGQFLSEGLAHVALRFGLPVIGLSLLVTVAAVIRHRLRFRARRSERRATLMRWGIAIAIVLILTIVLLVYRRSSVQQHYAAIRAHGGIANRDIPDLVYVFAPWMIDIFHDNFAKVTLVTFSQPMNDATVEMLNGIPSINRLVITSNIGDDDLRTLADLRHIDYLDLTNCDVGNVGMSHLIPLTSLKTLFLGGTKISDEGLVYVARLTSLEHLNLNNTAITDAGLARLQPLQRLRYLHAHDTRITADGVAELKSHNPWLLVNWRGMHDRQP